MTMKREEAIAELTEWREQMKNHGVPNWSAKLNALAMAIEALNNEPILCEDCKHRNTWDNPRLEPQYYRCGRNVKFRDYGYVREDDYCSLGERREESEVGE